ncbi:MAG: YARHG domain-containing protein [Gemmatimonadota bacterium]|nr:MAG: YARHG domain-containing protein [Gemmatimonadota bacterium]
MRGLFENRTYLIGIGILVCLLHPPRFSQDEDFCTLLRRVAQGRPLETEATLGRLSHRELRLVKNAVFARHGYSFVSFDLYTYFYGPGAEPCGIEFPRDKYYSVNLLTSIDRQNLRAIEEREKRLFELRTATADSLLASYARERWIEDFELASTIALIEDRLGHPEHVVLPDPDVLSPVGQWFHWRIHDAQVTLIALADDYSQQPGHHARVRLIRLVANDYTARVKTIYGLELNHTRRVNFESRFSEIFEHSRLFHLKFQHGGVWCYFRFSPDGMLREVAQSTYEVDNSELYFLPL